MKRKSPLFKKIDPVYNYDTKEIMGLLSKIKNPATKLHVFSPTFSHHKPIASTRTVKQAINKGHKDLNIWMYVNNFKKEEYIWNGYRCYRYIPERKSWNWVIDIDSDHLNPKRNKNTCRTIQDIIDLYNKSGLPLPYLITQTGPNNFHVAVLSETKTSYEAKEIYCRRLMGFSEDLEDRNVALELKEHGFDINYLKQSEEFSKIRLGGSPNYKYSNMNDKNGAFLCKTWINPNAGAMPEIKADVKRIEYKKDYRIDISKRIPMLMKIIRPVLGTAQAKKWSHYFASNYKFLSDGVLYISQELFAKTYDLTQPTVSRQIAKMKKAGLLIVTDGNYEFRQGLQRRAKVYQATAKLIDPVVKANNILKKLEDNEYVRGESNWRMLKDIKMLVHSGFSDGSIEKIVNEKMLNRPKDNRKTPAQVRYAVKRARFNFNMPFLGEENPYAPEIVERIEKLYDPNARQTSRNRGGLKPIRRSFPAVGLEHHQSTAGTARGESPILKLVKLPGVASHIPRFMSSSEKEQIKGVG